MELPTRPVTAASDLEPVWGPANDSHAHYFIHLVSGEVVTLAAVERVSIDAARLYIHVGQRLRRSIMLSEVYFCGTAEVPPPGFS